jgi:NADH-quinone oxidoreductase subunit C
MTTIAELQSLGEAVRARMPEAVTAVEVAFGELQIEVQAARVRELMQMLRDDPAFQFQQMMDLCGVDYPERPLRFEVVYQLLSLTRNHRIRVKVRTDEDTAVPSVIPVYPLADWFEREAFDMYGIIFADHPDLRRILTDYGFQGHPLRKDFPLTGYSEVRWDDELKRVVYEPVQLPQQFRTWDFLSPWEGAEYILPGDEKATPSEVSAPGPRVK